MRSCSRPREPRWILFNKFNMCVYFLCWQFLHVCVIPSYWVKKNYALFQDPNGMLQSLMPNILRKTTHWKPSWGGYVKQRRGEGCRCPNGCMTSGAPGTMGSWPASSKAVGSIRPMFLWFCSPSIIHWSNKDCQSHLAIAFQNHKHLSLQDRFVKYKQRTVTKTDSKISDMETGWYTKDDMAKVLKWNATLSCNLLGQNKQIIFAWLSNFKFYSVIHGLFNPWLWIYFFQLRKKIAGAIKCCEQDPEHLIRQALHDV